MRFVIRFLTRLFLTLLGLFLAWVWFEHYFEAALAWDFSDQGNGLLYAAFACFVFAIIQ